MSAPILITGGAGFIGSHLVARHIERGDNVHVVVRPESLLRRLQAFTSKIVVHRLHLGDRDALCRCFAEARPARVYHLAGGTGRRTGASFADARESVNDDLFNLLTLLAAAGDASPPPEIVVRAGSLAEYGPIATPYREDQREMPITAYAAAKVAGAHYSRMLQPELPFPVVTARLALVYGAEQSKDFLIPALIQRCLAGEASQVHRPGHRRDVLYIDDAIDALCRLGDAQDTGEAIVNIATGVAPTMREIAGQIIRSTGADRNLITFGLEGNNDGVSELRGSAELARKLLGWAPRISLADGIDRTVAQARAVQPLGEAAA